ncbi:hypothetical protein C8F01DRAFT_1252550 [Mycena amicta]|nr:hypothetical protein C8F01DRAFT_1252550 [Mycena amicta]
MSTPGFCHKTWFLSLTVTANPRTAEEMWLEALNSTTIELCAKMRSSRRCSDASLDSCLPRVQLCHKTWYLSLTASPRTLQQQQQRMFNSKFFALASMALLIGSSTVSAQLKFTCNAGGVSGDCAPFIKTFCNSVGIPINASDTVARCFTTGTPKLRCDFTSLNTGNVTDVPFIENCQNALNTVAVLCPLGGSGQFTGFPFNFSMDPNSGACGPQCGN